jgi:hypothetical protein
VRKRKNFSSNFALSRLFSSKVHENEVKREIQVSGVNLAPEIIEVFANSQIFHDHQPLKKKPMSPSSPPATFTIGSSKVDKAKLDQINHNDSVKLLMRLEEGNEETTA